MADAYSFVKGGKLKFKGDKHKRSVRYHIIAHNFLNCAEKVIVRYSAALPLSPILLGEHFNYC